MDHSSDLTKSMERCSVVLLDVAGTTTSSSYIADTLLKFALDNAEDFFKESWESEEVKEQIKAFQESDLELKTVAARFKELTENGSDNKGIKTIQGLIYSKGYENGQLKAHVFPDVPKALANWAKTLKVSIYSTGSVQAQKLLFKHTCEGDLSSHISRYFDQTVGEKTDPKSYENIAKEMSVDVDKIAFITDSIEEAKAAKEQGVTTFLIKRPENPDLPEEIEKDLTVISSFNELIEEENAAKRKIEDACDVQEPPSKISKTVDSPSEAMVTETEEANIDAKDEKSEQNGKEQQQEDLTDKGSADKANDDEPDKTEKKTDCQEISPEVVEEKTNGDDAKEEVKVNDEEKVPAKENGDKIDEEAKEMTNGDVVCDKNGAVEAEGNSDSEKKEDQKGIVAKKLENASESAAVSVEA